MKNPISLSCHLGDIPQASSSPSHFTGTKRKFGSPKKKKNEPAEISPELEQETRRRRLQKQEYPTMARVSQQVRSDVSQNHHCTRENSRDQGYYEDPSAKEWQFGLFLNGDRSISLGHTNYADVDAMTCCSSSSMTALGRFGVWCPEDSIVKKPRNLMAVPTVEDLDHMYKLPKRRQRDREDGHAGALLFNIADPFAGAALKHDSFSAPFERCTHVVEQEARSSKEGIVRHAKAGAAPQKDELFFEADEGMNFLDLRTGDDAIRYFAELESGGPVQFVYCNRVVSGKEFTPYDLVVVPRPNVDLEHFIISAAGMIHVEPGPGYYILHYEHI